MKRLTGWLVMIAMVVTCSAALAADEPKSDPRVESILERSGLKYNKTNSGYNIVYSYTEKEEKRTQKVIISALTSKFDNFEIREVYSFAYESENEFPAEISNMLLEDTEKKKIGAWSVLKTSKNKFLANFSMKIPADANSDLLLAVTRSVSAIADSMESRLTGTDKY